MSNRKSNFPKPVSSRYYTKKYFLNWGAYPTFLKSKGRKLFLIHERIIAISRIKPGMKILDLGCGRGELLVKVAKLGAEATGIDFSKASICLAKKSLLMLSKKLRPKIKLMRGDVKELGQPNNYYDRIFLIDLIEHLRPWEVDILLNDIRKYLKTDGQIIIHTWPNRLVVDYGYPINNLWQLLRNKPKIKHKREKYDLIMHINEQTQTSLKGSLKKHKYLSHVWLEKDGFYEDLEYIGETMGGIRRLIVKILARWPFKSIFFSNIYAIAWKNEEKNISSQLVGYQ